jgi:U3 small nucleolar RNA-associated protein 23
MRSKGDEYSGAVLVAKRFERRRCKHVEPVSSAQCIKEIIDKDNPHNYCIATQDIDLRKHLRKIPGVPLIHINRSVVVLEPPSQATKNKISDLEKAKTLPNEKELQFMKKKKKELKEQEKASKGDGKNAPSKNRKRKGPKQPNPLSMKKKKKSAPPNGDSGDKVKNN